MTTKAGKVKQIYNKVVEVEPLIMIADSLKKKMDDLMILSKSIVSVENRVKSMEDKQIGMWFIKNTNKQISRKVFANKVLKYLWDDAFKFNREKIFNISDERFNTLSKIIDYVENETGEIEDIFIAGLSQKIILANTFTDTFSNEKGRKGKTEPFYRHHKVSPFLRLFWRFRFQAKR